MFEPLHLALVAGGVIGGFKALGADFGSVKAPNETKRVLESII